MIGFEGMMLGFALAKLLQSAKNVRSTFSNRRLKLLKKERIGARGIKKIR